MRPAKILFVSIMMMIGVSTYAQDSLRYSREILKNNISFLMGSNYQNSANLEFGIARNLFERLGYHSHSDVLYLSTEVDLFGNYIAIPKIGFWISGGVALGLSGIHYTNFNKSTFAIRPETGFGFDIFKFTYGYNFLINENPGFRLKNHVFSFAVIIKIREL